MTTDVGIAASPSGVRQQTVRLPDVVRFALPAQHAVMILESLGNHGPFKAVQPVIQNFEAQLLAQQIKPDYEGPPAGAPTIDLETRAKLMQQALRERQGQMPRVLHEPIQPDSDPRLARIDPPASNGIDVRDFDAVPIPTPGDDFAAL